MSSAMFVKFFTLRDRKQTLRLPEAWTLRMGDMIERLPTSVFLRNPCGKMWVVKLAYNDITKSYSFEVGWDIFVKENKLQYMDLLVFKFNGTSTFDFKLFGKDNQEKEYVGVANIKTEEEELHPEEPEGPHLEEPEGLLQVTLLEFDDETTHEVEPRPKKSRKGEKRTRAINHADEDAVLEKACIPRPENPYFVTKRRAKRNVMYVPRDVIKDSMLEFPEEVILQDEKGREWTAQVQIWMDGRLWLSKGWASYCRRNNVEVDDWCIIEILKPETPGGNMYLKARRVPEASVQQS